MRITVFALSCFVLLASLQGAPARAQDPPPSGTAPDETPAPKDSDEVVQRYQEALDAFARGQFADAAALFKEVSETSQEPQRQTIAAEMAKEAERRIGGTLGSGPSGPTPGAGTQGPAADQPGNARTRLLLGSTLFLGLNYGWMVPFALGIDDDRLFAGTYLLTAGSSFLVPYLATRKSDISKSMATSALGGGALGAGHGALLYLLASGDNDDDNSQGLFIAMLTASVLEGYGGYAWAKRANMGEGTAVSLLDGALLGAGTAIGVEALFRGDGLDDTGTREIAAVVFLGSVLGMTGGYFAAERRQYSAGDAYIVGTAGAIGAYTAVAPLVLGDVDSPRVIAGLLLAGTGIGHVVGDYLVRDIDATTSQAALLGLSTAAGALLGAGTGYLIGPDDPSSDWLVPASALGAVAGFGLVYWALDLRNQTKPDDKPDDKPDAQVVGMSPWVDMGQSGNGDARGLSLVGRF